jgi:hypothetical protein
MSTTIQIDDDLRKRLEELKKHKRESLNEVIHKIIAKLPKKIAPNDVENLKKIAVPVLKGYGVEKAAVFGSFARGDATENSDIDLLVKYKEGTSLFDVVRLQNRLEAELGRKVDLVSYDFIDKYIRERILKESISLYE